MKYKLFIVICLSFLSCAAFAQQDETSVDEIFIPDSTVFRRDINTKPKKADFGVDVGLSYMFSSNGTHGPALSLSPHVTYPLGNKFAVSAGISLEHGNYYMPYYSYENTGKDFLPMTRMFVYASGHYYMSEKLTVTGSVYKQIVDVPNRNTVHHPPASYNYQGMSAGFDYKIAPGITVGARVRVESPGGHWNNSLYPGGNFSPLGF